METAMRALEKFSGEAKPKGAQLKVYVAREFGISVPGYQSFLREMIGGSARTEP
jgi:hypothetical protein